MDIQIEVETIAQLREALDAGAVSVLLDNFGEAQMREAVAVNAGRALLEVSGGVALDQLRWIAATGVDRISIGRLTKDVRAVEDRLLKVVPAEFMLDAHHWLILHGRYVCKARKPDCPQCVIRDLCRFKDKTVA